jgi:hypothetical protein
LSRAKPLRIPAVCDAPGGNGQVNNRGPIGGIVQMVKGRAAIHDWDLPMESGVVDLDKGGALVLK